MRINVERQIEKSDTPARGMRELAFAIKLECRYQRWRAIMYVNSMAVRDSKSSRKWFATTWREVMARVH